MIDEENRPRIYTQENELQRYNNAIQPIKKCRKKG